MSFLHPERLWLLLGVAALAAVVVGAVLRRRRAAARHAATALHAELVAPAAGRRHLVAPALALAALAVLVVALAQPTRLERVPRERGIVVLAIDTSLSMEATDIEPTRLEAAIAGASAFVEDLPDGIEVGVVAFDSDARLLVAPTTDHAGAQVAIASLSTAARTATGEGIFASLDAIADRVEADADAAVVPAAVVLLSDGVQTVGRSVESAAAAAVDADVAVTTIAYGTPEGTVSIDGQEVGVPADVETMAAVAEATGGSTFEATSAGELADVYADIQTTIGFDTEPVETTRAAIGVGLVLGLLAAGTSLALTDRAL